MGPAVPVANRLALDEIVFEHGEPVPIGETEDAQEVLDVRSGQDRMPEIPRPGHRPVRDEPFLRARVRVRAEQSALRQARAQIRSRQHRRFHEFQEVRRRSRVQNRDDNREDRAAVDRHEEVEQPGHRRLRPAPVRQSEDGEALEDNPTAEVDSPAVREHNRKLRFHSGSGITFAGGG
ncbi:UNVERIFIED_CONTAM: hypothetical protein PYX00_008648 [Menopon gallinae]|uniref:Uncharacterized protein n=1 Tax=Menopon gallinae TaxID=328185 RepID=A0AAW2HNY3_9NEOP